MCSTTPPRDVHEVFQVWRGRRSDDPEGWESRYTPALVVQLETIVGQGCCRWFKNRPGLESLDATRIIAAPWPSLTVHEPFLKRALTRKVGLPGWCIALQERMNWREGSGKAFQARLSANDLLSLRVSAPLQLHQPATSLTTSRPRHHHLPTASTWLAWDRPIYVTWSESQRPQRLLHLRLIDEDSNGYESRYKSPIHSPLPNPSSSHHPTQQYSAVRFFHLPLSSIASAGSGILFTSNHSNIKTTYLHTQQQPPHPTSLPQP
jgi:hypothetical protein